MNRRMLLALLVSSSLAGCGGGGGGRTLSPLPGAPSAAPTAGGTSSARGRATLRVTIPRQPSSNARHRDFVSPSTDGIAVEVKHVTGTTTDYDVTVDFDVAPGSTTNCTGSDPQICTLQIPAPIAPSPDFDTFTFTLYDQAPAGTPPAFGVGAHSLGSGTVVQAIAANVNNTIAVHIGGTPASVAFAEPVISGDGYLGFGANFGVDALDAQHNVILGGVYDPYNPAFALAVTDQNLPAGATTLALAVSDLSSYSPTPPACNAAATAQTSVTTCRSSDVLSFAYVQPIGGAFDTAYYATVASQSVSLPGGSLYVSPIYVTDTTDTGSPSSGGPAFAQGSSGTSPSIALNGATGTVTLSEPGPAAGSLPYSFTAAQNANCSGVIAPAGIAATSGTTFTIASATGAAAVRRRSGAMHQPHQHTFVHPGGTTGCIVTFTDNYGGSVALDVTDSGAASQFVAIPGETLYAGQNTANDNTFIEYDMVSVQPNSTNFGDPYFIFSASKFGPGYEGTQVSHTVPDQSGNFTVVIADDVAGAIFTFPVTAPSGSSTAYTVGSNVAAACCGGGGKDSGSGTIAPPTGGVAVDSHGNAYASESATIGIYSTPALSPINSVTLPGTSPNATGIALDSGGRVFVADSVNDVVDVYGNDFAGNLTLQNQISTGTGSDPRGVAIDPTGDLFVVLDNDGQGGSGQSQVVVFPPGATTQAAAANVTPAGLGVAADDTGQVFVETAGVSPTFGGPAGGGIYQYAFVAAAGASPATLTSVGQLSHNGTPVDATGGYLDF